MTCAARTLPTLIPHQPPTNLPSPRPRYELAWVASVLATTSFAAPARGAMPTFERPALALLLASRLLGVPWWLSKHPGWGGGTVVGVKQVEVGVFLGLLCWWLVGHVPQVEEMVGIEQVGRGGGIHSTGSFSGGIIISTPSPQHMTGYSVIFMAYSCLTFTFLGVWYVLFVMEELEEDDKEG